MSITQEFLKELLNYNHITGEFRWKVYRNQHVRIGDRAGTINENNYRQIQILGKMYREHRLVWLYVYGKFPTKEMIDHIDGDKQNNKVDNLREATRQENTYNSCIRENKSSRFKGVCWDKSRLKWIASSQDATKKHKHLGRYESEEEAHQAYQGYVQELHGDFYKAPLTKESENE